MAETITRTQAIQNTTLAADLLASAEADLAVARADYRTSMATIDRLSEARQKARADVAAWAERLVDAEIVG